MITFKEYSDSFEIFYDPKLLDYSMKDMEYCIFEGSMPLLTPGGNIFSHPKEAVIRMMVTDMQLNNSSTLKDISSPLLYSFFKDVFRTGEDPFLLQWENLLITDPFVQIKTSGRSNFQPFTPDDPLFTFSFITLSRLTGIVSDFAGKIMSEVSMDESESHPFQELLRLSYERLSSDRKVAILALSSMHHSSVVMPLLLVSGEISAVEYVKGLISLKIQPEDLFLKNLANIASLQTYLGLLIQNPGSERKTSALINEGEGISIEFKSTLRWDIRAGKASQNIERACLKTISAFLNTYGGCLFIGIRDDGSIEGIETDKFVNEDKFLLHLWTLIRTCLGKDFSPYIRTRLEKVEGKTVCIVDCLPSNRPVFLRQPGFDEEMYIRVGPSSNSLDISEALNYIEDHFHI
ncbi:MAG: ATP-binding protein [Bacteroidia bacterium]|nr:ATP-binding protein [Bacteroidia bacterium]